MSISILQICFTAGKGPQMVPAEPSQQLQESQCWEMLVHSRTPVHLACSPHPPTALVSVSLSLRPLLRTLERGCAGWVSLSKESFPPSALQPRPWAAASSPGTEPSPRSRGGLGSLRRTAAVPAPAGMATPAPAPSLLRSSQGRVPGRSLGKRPFLPGGHLRPGSSPSSAFPDDFRLPLFLHLPGARTFVPARPRLGVPPPPALPERAGGSAAMKRRGLPRHPRRAARGREPSQSLRLLPAHLRRPFSAQIRHQFSFWIISSSKKSSPKNIKHRPTGGKRAPSGTGTRPPPAPQPGKLQPRSRSGPLFLVRLNSLLPCGCFRNIYPHWGGEGVLEGELRTHRPGAAEPPAPLRPPRSAGLSGGQAARAAEEASRYRPSPAPSRSAPARDRAGSRLPGKGTGPENRDPRRNPTGLRQEPAPARPRPLRRGLSAEAPSPGHRPGRCLPRCPRPSGTGHGTSLGPGPSPGRGPIEGTGGTRTRSGAARAGGAGTEPSPTARHSTSSATKTFLRSIPQPVRPRGPAPRLTWPGTARARSGGKVRAGGAGRSRSRCPRPGPGRGGSGGDGAGVGSGGAGTPLDPDPTRPPLLPRAPLRRPRLRPSRAPRYPPRLAALPPVAAPRGKGRRKRARPLWELPESHPPRAYGQRRKKRGQKGEFCPEMAGCTGGGLCRADVRPAR